MYVKKLHLRNVRSYKSDSIEFSPGINLIIGPNNSGKSTVIKSLLKLQSGPYQLAHEDIRKTKQSSKIYVELEQVSDRDLQIIYPDKTTIPKKNPKSLGIAIWTNEQNNNKQEYAFIVERDKWVADLSNEDLRISNINGSDDTSMTPFSAMTSMENEDNFIYPFLTRRRINHSHSSQSNQAEAFNVTPELRNLPIRIKNLTNTSHPYNKEFAQCCRDILKFDVGSIASASKSGSEEKVGMFCTNTDIIYLESMGEGVANILMLLTVLMTENNKLILIEELENDIHPEVLKKLLMFILKKAKNNQIVISTHSNIVLKYLASFENAKIFYTNVEFKKSVVDGKRITLPTTTITEIGNNANERFEALQKLGYSPFDFDMYKSYLIFEESSAESIVRYFIIPEFAPQLIDVVKTIGSKGATTVENYFEDFVRLFVYINGNPIYDKKAWIITDGDIEGQKAITKLKSRYPQWPKDNFLHFSKTNFEEYYPTRFRKLYAEIENIKDRSIRYEKKRELTKQVLAWTNDNKDTARKEFKTSAKEVIEILDKISLSLGLTPKKNYKST